MVERVVSSFREKIVKAAVKRRFKRPVRRITGSGVVVAGRGAEQNLSNQQLAEIMKIAESIEFLRDPIVVAQYYNQEASKNPREPDRPEIWLRAVMRLVDDYYDQNNRDKDDSAHKVIFGGLAAVRLFLEDDYVQGIKNNKLFRAYLGDTKDPYNSTNMVPVLGICPGIKLARQWFNTGRLVIQETQTSSHH